MYQLIVIQNDQQIFESRKSYSIKEIEYVLVSRINAWHDNIVQTECRERLVNLDTDEVIWRPGQRELTIGNRQYKIIIVNE